MKKSLLLMAVSATLSLGVSAQQQTKPEYALCQYEDGALVSSLSDNGQWATFYGLLGDGTGNNAGARLYNVSTKTVEELNGGLDMNTVTSCSAKDVDNAGNIVVGELNHKPAYYSTKTKSWTYLEYTANVSTGVVNKITPDGHYAVGTVSSDFDINNYQEYGVLWDLNTGKEIALTNLPKKDMAHNETNMNRFLSISSDGRYILGCMSFIYLPSWNDLGGVFYYVYDVKNQSYKPIGFIESDTERWKPTADGINFLTNAFMSNNGLYVTGGANIIRYNGPEDKFGEEFELPFVFNTQTGEIKLIDNVASKGLNGWVVDNQGNIYGAEAQTPYRTFSVFHDGYWVDYASGIRQHYGVNYLSAMGLDNSGTPIAMSDDAKTLAIMPSVFNSYIIKTPNNFMDFISEVNLLSAYTVAPAANATISRLNTVTLTFDREVNLLGAGTSAKLVNKILSTEVDKSSKITVQGKTVTIEFKNGKMEDGMLYELVVPAKTFCILNDEKRTSPEIKVTYMGREEVPVKVVSTSPKENASVAKIEMGTNPIILTLDVDAAMNYDVATGALYRDNDTAPLANIFFEQEGNTVKAYPAAAQYLYKNHTYRLVVPAGSFTDVTGNAATGNEKFELNLRGAYEREISYDKNVLFSDDLNKTGITNFLVWDNDHNKFSEVAKSHGFSDTPTLQSNYAWMPVKDTQGSSDIALASTSMYDPAGQADDWLVLPQLYIMDHLCKLKFQSQSYLKDKQDRIKVYVWEYDNTIDYMTEEIANRIRKEGVLVYDEIQNPGAEEDLLANDWKDNSVSLEQFKGKNVYIAFLNDNNDQSEVYLDNIQVLHELPFYAQLTNDELVVAKNEMIVEGVVDVRTDKKVYNDVTITLHDAAGKQLDMIHQTGVSYKQGDKFNFKFNKALSLKVGEENKFTVKFQLNDDANEVTSSVKSLAFQPTKRVVLEECTGQGCSNCPLGHEAIHRMSATYGDKLIPIGIHAYNGDKFGTSNVISYAQFLGLASAPSARINRNEFVSMPMMTGSAGHYIMNSEDPEKPLWADMVASELAKPVEGDISATMTYNEATKSYSVPVSVKYALSTDELNLKVFAVVLENGLTGAQTNGFSSTSDPLLGEWGLGGKYGQPTVADYVYNHVARAIYGTSYTGTADLLPNTMTAGESYTTTLNIPVPSEVKDVTKTDVVVMLFDGNTDKVINSCVAHLGGSTGIDGVLADGLEGVDVSVNGSSLQINADEKADVKVYSVSGSLLNHAQGTGSFEVAVPEYKGVVLVNISTAQGSVTKKVIL